MHVRPVGSRKIGESQEIFALRGLVDGCPSSGWMSLPFQSARINRLWLSARRKGSLFIHFLIDKEFFGAKFPPGCRQHGNCNQSQNPFVSCDPTSLICVHCRFPAQGCAADCRGSPSPVPLLKFGQRSGTEVRIEPLAVDRNRLEFVQINVLR